MIQQQRIFTCTLLLGGGGCFGPNFLLCSFTFYFSTPSGKGGGWALWGARMDPPFGLGCLRLSGDAQTPFQTSEVIATCYLFIS